MRQALTLPLQEGGDTDVIVEEEVARKLCTECLAQNASSSLERLGLDRGLHLFGLRKVFPSNNAASCLPRAKGAAVVEEPGHLANSGVIGPGAAEVEGPSRDDVVAALAAIKEHERVAALAGTWLSVPEGQCFCLLGPNGAGKTTTIKCLVGVSTRETAAETFESSTISLPTSFPLIASRPDVASDRRRRTGFRQQPEKRWWGGSLSIRHGRLPSVRCPLGNPDGPGQGLVSLQICPKIQRRSLAVHAQEHLLLFADIKGLPWSDRHKAASQLLGKVSAWACSHSSCSLNSHLNFVPC